MSGSEDTQKYGQSRGSKNVRQTNDEPLANFFVFDDLKSTLTFLSYKEKNRKFRMGGKVEIPECNYLRVGSW